MNGLTNNEISERLFISKYTVENHIKHVFEKTGVRNRVELTSWIHTGWENIVGMPYKVGMNIETMFENNQAR